MTRQRRVILEELKKMDSHPTADEVFQVVRRRLPRMSLGTVYRNLETMSRSGIIKKLEISGSARRFDAKLDTHHHVRCVKCGKIEDLPAEPFSIIEIVSDKISNYEIIDHFLELVGICPDCRKAGTGPNDGRQQGERRLTGKEKALSPRDKHGPGKSA
jgi:Fur family ferric uptake transcriptional regulator